MFKIFQLIFVFPLIAILLYLLINRTPAYIMALSISTSGDYVISTHANKSLILWNIKNKKYKIISNQANIYSAYFIKDRQWFMWQNDTTNIVYIQDINGTIIKKFKAKPTYGHVITNDLKYYFYCDEDWNIFCQNNSSLTLIKKGFKDDGFSSNLKLLNLSLNSNNQLLLSAGDSSLERDNVSINNSNYLDYAEGKSAKFSHFNGVVIWDIKSHKAKHKLAGNMSKTTAIFSPDDRVIISGDENSIGIISNVSNGKVIRRISSNVYNANKKTSEIDSDKIYEINVKYFISGAYYALKFIDTKGDYLSFVTKLPYAILYNINTKKILKYFPLETNPWPCINDYSRNLGIDTAPKAKILVIAKQYENGITVYQFENRFLLLKCIWSATL